MLTLAHAQSAQMHRGERNLLLLAVRPCPWQRKHDRARKQEVGRSGAHQRDEADVLRHGSEFFYLVDMEAGFPD